MGKEISLVIKIRRLESQIQELRNHLKKVPEQKPIIDEAIKRRQDVLDFLDKNYPPRNFTWGELEKKFKFKYHLDRYYKKDRKI
jgi:predicted nuclease with TOPRIM domain